MRFARQRALQAVDPVVAFAVTIALGVAGAGYWSLIIGGIAGVWAGGLTALMACPYRVAFRFDRSALREYFSFSWPLLISTGSGVIVIQAGVIVGEEAVGLVGVGAIGLAATIARFADHVDQILTQTIYPAICVVRDRTELLFEAFTKSNRLALMWGMPFGIGLALFAPDLVTFILGEKWRIATGLIQVFGILAAMKQIAFNWTAFQRAVGDTRPMAVNGIAALVTFSAVGVPMTITHGLAGYAIGMIAVTTVELVVRTYFLTRLFSGFEMLRHSARAIAPTIPAVAAVLVARLLEGPERSAEVVIVELVLYTLATVLATWFAERALLKEVAGYLRGASRTPEAA
jgi:PST family polysaccharide transporter